VPGERAPTEAHENIALVTARTAGDKRLSVKAAGKGRWSIESTASEATIVSYRVKLPGIAPVLWHGAHDGGLILDGARTLLYVDGLLARPVTLEIAAPAGWALRAPLTREGGSPRFSAASYAELAQAIVALGEGRDGDIEIADLRYPFVIDRRGADVPFALDHLTQPLQRGLGVLREITDPPLARPPLLILVEGETGSVARPAVAVVGMPDFDALANPVLLLSPVREILRGWIATRLPSPEVAAIDWSSPPEIPTLWASEGFAEYLARHVLLRAGLVDAASFLGELTERALARRNHLLASYISPETASRRIWKSAWSEGDGVDHALQGHLIAVLLDIEIRAGSDGARSLADLLHAAAAGRDASKGIDSAALEALISKVAGRDLAPLQARCVRGTGHLPWDEVLPKVGLRFPLFEWKVRDPGLRCHLEDGVLRVGALDNQSTLFIAGLRRGDHLVAVNQRKVRTPGDVDRAVARLAPGQKLRLDIRRDDRQRSIRISLEDAVALEVPVEETSEGVRITRVPPGPLEAAGMQIDDVLEKVDNRRITAAGDIPEALRRVRGGRTLFTLKRGGRRIRIPVAAPQRSFWRGSIDRDPKAPEAARSLGDGMLRPDDG
jgi:predicted metalloprotease with PDZ domain